jgi:hypothetical protein
METKNQKITNTNKHRSHRDPHCGYQYKEFTELGFADCHLPGKFKTIEVENESQGCRHSYAMATKLHPNSTKYVDFWGEVDPYGEGCNSIYCCIYENDPGYGEIYRWVVTTGRHTHTGMSTRKFDNLEDAMKFMVSEMEKTQLKYDKILGEKTQMWDFDAIRKHNEYWNVKMDLL